MTLQNGQQLVMVDPNNTVAPTAGLQTNVSMVTVASTVPGDSATTSIATVCTKF